VKQERLQKNCELPKWFVVKCQACRKCKLARYRRQVVIGRGDVPADLLFIGEAPGKTEDLLGEAFVGPAGKLLDKMLQKACSLSIVDKILNSREIDRIKNITYYITNTILCHPTDEREGDNRQPNSYEVNLCTSHIMQIYNMVKPKRVILIGKVADKYYAKEFREAIRIQHPAFILRQGGINSPHFLNNARTLSELFTEFI